MLHMLLELTVFSDSLVVFPLIKNFTFFTYFVNTFCLQKFFKVKTITAKICLIERSQKISKTKAFL